MSVPSGNKDARIQSGVAQKPKGPKDPFKTTAGANLDFVFVTHLFILILDWKKLDRIELVTKPQTSGSNDLTASVPVT